MLIAIGIGLHNFAEGLAIGQSAARNDIALAAVLVIGFALHNATGGLRDRRTARRGARPGWFPYRPSWAFLLALGVIGGGPTFVGTAVGHGFTSEAVSVLFLTLAAGSISVRHLPAARRRPAGPSSRRCWPTGLLIGLLAGFLTDAIILCRPASEERQTPALQAERW